MICSVFTESTVVWKKLKSKKSNKQNPKKLIYLWKPMNPMIFKTILEQNL